MEEYAQQERSMRRRRQLQGGNPEGALSAESALGRAGKYRDSTGIHDIGAGQTERNVNNVAGTMGNLGQSVGNSAGAVGNLGAGLIGKAVKGIGGFFKKLFTGKNPFK
jgi:hypothetical protein